MKSPEEWMEEWFPTNDSPNWPIVLTKAHIEAIQRDALRMANCPEDLLEQAEINVKDFDEKMEFYKSKWHEARRYLRAANKGAERNNMVMRLQAADISSLLERIKQLEQTNQ